MIINNLNSEDQFYFNLLKSAIATTFLKNHTAPAAIEEWKGEEIVLFQEDLFAKVKARVSEKWFYTYCKKEASKLPRIDMLNMLSQYVGFRNWAAFKKEHTLKLQGKTKTKSFQFVVLALVSLICLLWLFTNTKNEFKFCFVDDLQHTPITDAVNIKIISTKESAIELKTDSLGCFSYTTNAEYITFVVKSPYYKTDTIVRYIDTNEHQLVPLATDDYALMLKYYAEGNSNDFKKHKAQLNELIADEAIIYQFHSNTIGVEVFSKEDFVRMLTIPTSGLRRVKILDRTLKDGKIVKLKFIML